MKVKQISKKNYKMIIESIRKKGVDPHLPKTKNVKSIVTKKGELIYVDDEPTIIYAGGEYLPFIGSLGKFRGLKKIVVDTGAVKYLTNGADVMRPGIVDWEEFNKGDIVVVHVEKYDTPIMIGRALIDSKDLEEMERGKVIENLHHVGDVFWEASKREKY